ncbi:MAG: hypothetical protein Q4E88_02725 [Coriobacteriia bacterium]|nr:hypothetical protein [Coriobacteriia bacterium]
MIFRGLDKNFVLLAEVPAINMQWKRRYYDYGEFEVQLRWADYDPDMAYIWNTKTNEVAIIDKFNPKNEGHGDFVYLSGYFCESWLSYGVVVDHGTVPVNVITACRTMVTNRIINNSLRLPATIEIGNLKSHSSNIDAYPDDESEVGLLCKKLLTSIEYAQKLRFDYSTKKFYYDIVQGIDRSVEGANHCVFSERLKNINDLDYSYDQSDYKNYADIKISRGGNPERFDYTNVDISKNNEPIRKIKFEVSDTKSATDHDARVAARQKASLELLNHKIVENANFEPATNSYEYMVDYDLGDIVQIVIAGIEVSISLRIIGIDEVHKKHTREIKLQFGDMKKLNYRKRW